MRHVLACAAALFAVASVAPASAAVTLDQQALVVALPQAGTQVVVPARRLIGGQLRDTRYVQTATAGVGGTLTAIDLQGYRNFTQPADTLRLTLIDGDYAAGARTIVGSRDLNAANAPTFTQARALDALVNFDTSGFGYQVAAGGMFSILIELIPLNQVGSFNFITANTFPSVQQPDGSFVIPTVGANYSRGALYQLGATGTPFALTNDIGFRSFVDAAGAVPEPATWAMLILGFGLTGAALRRRRLIGALA